MTTTQNLSGWAGVGALHAAAHPGSKLAKQYAAAAAKAAKPQPTKAERLAKSIKRQEAVRTRRLAWAQECRAMTPPQTTEAERWENWVRDELDPWLELQKKNLAELLS